MSRPARIGIAALGLFGLLAAGWLVAAGRSRGEAPDLVIVTIDTLRVDHLGAYGHAGARTPVIDGLARRGTRFTQATTPFPRTTPGLASLFTGLWPHHHGSREVGQEMGDAVTLAQVLQRRGYATLGVSSNGTAARKQGFDRGFDRFVESGDLPTTLAKGVTDRALAELAKMPREAPLFVWVHYIDPHFPYLPPSAWADPEEGPVCRELAKGLGKSRWRIGKMFSDLGGRSSRALPDCRRLYDGEIAYNDFEVGRLLEGLEAAGRDEALIVFTSDHGENLGEGGLYYEHGPSVHDAAMRVPLILAGPGVPRRVDRRAIRLEDLMPTLLALLGVPPAERPAMDGEDLSARLGRWAWLGGGGEPVAFAEGGSALLPNTFGFVLSGRDFTRLCLNAGRFSLCARRGEEPELYDHEADPDLRHEVGDRYPHEKALLLEAWGRWQPEEARERTVRTPRFKLVERPRWQGGYERRLYDLEADPGESRDVSREHAEVARRLGARLDAWTSAIPTGALRPERDEDTLNALRALGYVE